MYFYSVFPIDNCKFKKYTTTQRHSDLLMHAVMLFVPYDNSLFPPFFTHWMLTYDSDATKYRRINNKLTQIVTKLKHSEVHLKPQSNSLLYRYCKRPLLIVSILVPPGYTPAHIFAKMFADFQNSFTGKHNGKFTTASQYSSKHCYPTLCNIRHLWTNRSVLPVFMPPSIQWRKNRNAILSKTNVGTVYETSKNKLIMYDNYIDPETEWQKRTLAASGHCYLTTAALRFPSLPA